MRSYRRAGPTGLSRTALPLHPGADLSIGSNSDANRHQHGDRHGNLNQYAHKYADRNSNQYAHKYTNINGNSNQHADEYCNCNRYGDGGMYSFL